MKIELVRLVRECSDISIRWAGEGKHATRSRVPGHIRHTELVLGAQMGISDLDAWDRRRLWTEVEKAGKRSLRFCTKCPIDLDDAGCIELGYKMARFIVDERNKGAVDFVFHGPVQGRALYPHLHFLVTHLKVTPAGLVYPSAVNYWREDIRIINEHWCKMFREFVSKNDLDASILAH